MITNETMEGRDRKTILVVEDDPAMRRMLVQSLVAQGKYRVMAVDNGADAEDRILSDPPRPGDHGRYAALQKWRGYMR